MNTILIFYERLLYCSTQHWKNVYDHFRIQNFHLHPKIAEYRDKTVDDLIKDVAFEYLERVTYNNSGDITKGLKSLAIPLKNFDLVKLDTAIKRRHGIVHRADRIYREEEVGKVAPIQTTHVLKWVEEVERFVELVFETQESQDNDKGVRPLNPK